jgi:transcriptional regulator NrdR family protein
MIRCPYCDAPQTIVPDQNETTDGYQLTQSAKREQCANPNCGNSFQVTVEMSVSKPIQIGTWEVPR